MRLQSPSQGDRPPKKKKVNHEAAVIKEETTMSLQVASHDPVTQQDVGGGQHNMKFAIDHSIFPLLHYPTRDLQRRPRPVGAGSHYLHCELNDSKPPSSS